MEDVNASTWLRYFIEAIVGCNESGEGSPKPSPTHVSALQSALGGTLQNSGPLPVHVRGVAPALGFILKFAQGLRRADPLRSTLLALPSELPPSLHHSCATAWVLLEQRQMEVRAPVIRVI